MIRIGEKSFTAKDVPENFYMVTNYPDSLDLSNLEEGKIEGVTGISDTGLIATHFLGVGRNIMLKIDGPQTVEHNNLTRIMYDNPHYLVSNNLYAIARIYQKERNWKKGEYEQIMIDFLELFVEYLEIGGGPLAQDLRISAARESDRLPPEDVYNVSDFVEYLQELFNALDDRRFQFNRKEIEHAAYKALEDIGDLYGSEGEWILKDKELVLPPDVVVVMTVPDMYDDWIADTLSTDQRRDIMMYRMDRKLESVKEVEEFCFENSIAFYPIDEQEFKELRTSLFKLGNSEAMDKLTKEYNFL